MENNNPTVELSLDLVNAVLGYLGKRPYEEVQNFISAVQQQAQASLQAKQQAQKPVELPVAAEEAANERSK